jgi:hypothetical protein
MLTEIVLFIAWTALEVLMVVASLRWGYETGQWKEIEEPKYRMLIDHELQPWPGREKAPHNDEQSEQTISV